MKVRYLIGITVIAVLLLFSANGLTSYQSALFMEPSYLSTSVQSKIDEEAEVSDGSLEQDEKIFSMATLFPLIIALVGIVAFRRNNYS